MSVLASLVRAYNRMADRGEVPPYGYSSEKIGFVISLNEDGSPAGIPTDLRTSSGRKLVAPLMRVPASFKRPGITPRPFFLWDNSAFVLGVTASEGKDAAKRFNAFREMHLKVLADNRDKGLIAVHRFIEKWTPLQFNSLGWSDGMKDQNIVFVLESERLRGTYIHDRPAARALWARLSVEGEKTKAACLVTG